MIESICMIMTTVVAVQFRTATVEVRWTNIVTAKERVKKRSREIPIHNNYSYFIPELNLLKLQLQKMKKTRIVSDMPIEDW